ncbi:MAG: hypothetical protein ABUS51_02905 [Acidobacteriota bacterium]
MSSRINYRDLAEFGLPLISPEAPEFFPLVREMEAIPRPFRFQTWPVDDLARAAILRNQSGKAIVTLAYAWRYTTERGQTYASRYFNLGSSLQFDFLSGQGGVVRDMGTFILPGSKRLLTEQGTFGSNFDVLPPEQAGAGGGVGMGGGGQRGMGPGIIETELVLDSVIFEDGLCAGPDESGLFGSLTKDLADQRQTAQEIVSALRNGASPGQVFEILRPLARHPRQALSRAASFSPLLRSFANSAIHRLVQGPEPDLLAWFEQIAQATPLRLHRPDPQV